MQSDSQQIVLLHFNDAYNIVSNSNNQLGFKNFYDHFLRTKQLHPDSLLIFSGDAFAPSKLSRVLRGWQMAQCLKLLKIDVSCYGNHDFDFKPDHCLRLAQYCQCPWLMGNIKYKDNDKNIGQGLDFLIKEYKGIKIGFMGLAGPDFIGRLISDYKDKLQYIDIVTYAKEMCAILKQKGCELIIALTHVRIPIDKQLAQKVPQIDLILGGHDHKQINQVVNQIPIIKSGSDFSSLSVIKINKYQTIKRQNSLNGRRWMILIQCQKIGPALKEHPQVDKIINKALEQVDKIYHQKMLVNNRQNKKPKVAPLPQNQWLLQYGYLNSRISVSLKAGLSAQICLAKYIAFKRKAFYVGYKRGAPQPTLNFVEETLQFILKQFSSYIDVGDTALFSPGVCSVPYLLQTGNILYLPSQFLVGVNSLQQLTACINQANSKGYKCYAVMGYDPFIRGKLCTWIKFTQLPRQYIQLIEHFKIQNLITMSVHDRKGNNHGAERSTRLVSGIVDTGIKRTQPLAGDIYLMFINQSSGKQIGKDLSIFEKIFKNVDQNFWIKIAAQQRCEYIHDWQSGIDCIKTIGQSFANQIARKLNFFYIVDSSS